MKNNTTYSVIRNYLVFLALWMYIPFFFAQALPCNLICNSDFEASQLVNPGSYIITSQNNVPCWKTTASDQKIEVWGNGFNGTPSYSGNQFIELNANMVSTLYQDFTGVPGSTVTVYFAHRGRAGTDVLSVSIGPAGGPYMTLGTFSAGNTAWVYNNVTYTFPASGNVNYSLRFNSVSSAGGSSAGNFLDAISVTLPQPQVNLSVTDATCQNATGGSIAVNATGGTPPYTYAWQPAFGNTSQINNLSAGVYNLTLTDAYGCSVEASATISGSGAVNNISAAVCEGEFYSFGGTDFTSPGIYEAHFIAANGCDSLVILNLHVYPKYESDVSANLCAGETYTFNGQNYTQTGIYNVLLQSVHGCDSLIRLNLNFEALQASVSQDATICTGVPFQLNASGGSSYAWSPANFLSNPNISNPMATITETTVFSVEISTACATETLTVTLTVPEHHVIVSENTSVCAGNSVQLLVSGGQSYLWSPSVSVDDPTSSHPVVTPAATTHYQVEITTQHGCILHENVLVTVFHNPPVPVMEDSLSICNKTSAVIGVSGAESYLWSPAINIAPLHGSSVTINPGSSMTYYCDFTNACGTVRDSIFAEVIVPHIQAFSDTIICPGESVVLSASGGIAYQWFPASTLSHSQGKNVTATPVQNTSYHVIGADVFGCFDTAYVKVDLFPKLFVQVSDEYAMLGDEIRLSVSGNPNGVYIWSPAEYLSCVTCMDPVANPDKEMTYTVTYIDSNGCRSSDNMTIFYDPVLYVPNAFIPDGNNLNDIFKAAGGNVNDFEMTIFNRWGEKIYATTSLDESWDGTYKSEQCPEGTYVWKIKYTNLKNDRKIISGHINLIR